MNRAQNLGKTRNEIAAATGISYNTLSRVYNNKHFFDVMEFDRVVRLFDFLGGVVETRS